MECIETKNANVYIKRIGKGFPVIVLGGGPGLSITYMIDTFQKILSKETFNLEFIFIEQIGCGMSKSNSKLTIDSSINSIIEVINFLNIDKCDFIAHSWGAFLTYSLIANKSSNITLRKLILLNPVPSNREKYDYVGTKLINRIPESILNEIALYVNENTKASGKKLMEVALPYYCGKKSNLPQINFDYNINTYNEISTTLNNYNYNNIITSSSINIITILGKNDYITKDDLIINNNVYFLEGGHFSFIEDSISFLQILNNIYKD